MYVCEYCKSELMNLSSLNKHKKTNKKCLLNRSGKVQTDLVCDGCQHVSTSMTQILKHFKTCHPYIILKQQQEIKRLNLLIKSQEIQIKELEGNSKVDKKENFYQTLINEHFNAITDEELEESVQSLSFSDISQGGRGIARFLQKYCITTDNLIITDESRRKGLWKGEDNIVIIDTRLRYLLQKIMIILHPVASAVVNNYIETSSLQGASQGAEGEVGRNPDINTYTKELQMVFWIGAIASGNFINGTQLDKKILPTFLSEFVKPYTKQHSSVII